MVITPDRERLAWIATNLWIINKSGERVRLVPNSSQLRLHMHFQAQRQRGLPVRVDLLKSRQMGQSTWITAEEFYEVYHWPNWRAMTISLDADSTDHIFGMTKMYYEELPKAGRLRTKRSNRKEVAFINPHRSRMIAQTAGKMDLGRSFTLQFCHSSEVAFWDKAEENMASLTECVPLKEYTTFVNETTGNGQGGWFYDHFMEAVNRQRKHPDDFDGYQPVFFPWYEFSEYAVDPPAGIDFTREERQIQKRFNLTEAQLYWRRLKLREKNNDLELFSREYPATIYEAFAASGNPVFPNDTVDLQASWAQTRNRIGFFDRTGETVRFLDDEDAGKWQIYLPPESEHDYVIGIDTMEGRLSDVKNPKSSLDFDGMVVLDRNTGDIVAMYHGRGDQVSLARQAFRACLWYNEAYVAPEIPQSMVLLAYFKEHGYPNIYNRQIHEDRDSEGESEVLGWRTTSITRKWLVEDFLVATGDGSLRVRFGEIVDEMRSFVREKDGTPRHLPGQHDDLLFAAMIAFQAHKRCPMGSGVYSQAYTGAEPVRDRHQRSLSRIGAVDDWDPEDESEDDENETRTV